VGEKENREKHDDLLISKIGKIVGSERECVVVREIWLEQVCDELKREKKLCALYTFRDNN
jgi:hypothetical protein